MRLMLELLRIIILLLLVVGIAGRVEKELLSSWIEWEERYSFLLIGGNVLLLFVVYRNKLQFGGWFPSVRAKKLSRRWTIVCLTAGAACVAAPAVLHLLGRHTWA